MLQAFVDESVTDGELFVMGGYISSVEKWLKFSDDWAKILTLRGPHYRYIEEYKAAEMKTAPHVIEQSGFFYKVIEDYVDFGVLVSVRLHDLEDAFNRIDWPDWLDNVEYLRSPYLYGFKGITVGLAMIQKELGLSEPIDFIFDDHSEKKKCRLAWEAMKQQSPPDIRNLLGDEPVFKDSKIVLPLQAADLYAHWGREAQLSGETGELLKIRYPWSTCKSVPGVNIFYEKGMIERDFGRALQSCILLREGKTPDEVRAILQPEIVAARSRP